MERGSNEHLPIKKKSPITDVMLDPKITNPQDTEVNEFIGQEMHLKFGDEAKDLQINAVMSLLKKQHSLVLAGTGYGKSRIAKI